MRRTVDPAYTWYPYPHQRYIEPLARTLLEERKRRDFLACGPGAPQGYCIPCPPPERGEVIESGELRQDDWDESASQSH